jgi:hypothetical protein
MISLQLKPIKNWRGKVTEKPEASRFRQTYSNTKKLLLKELAFLKPLDSICYIQLYVHPNQIRADGELRADARPQKSGVILSLTRRGKKLSDGVYQALPRELSCDKYDDWQDNLRAITLTLTSLRDAERHGVLTFDEMFDRLALPPADGFATGQEAAAFIAYHTNELSAQILTNQEVYKSAFKRAARKFHPDTNPDETDNWLKLEAAKRTLDEYFADTGGKK